MPRKSRKPAPPALWIAPTKAGRHLDLDGDTVRRLAREGKIPAKCFVIGGKEYWRISMAWILSARGAV